MNFDAVTLKNQLAQWLGGSAAADALATLILLGVTILLFGAVWLLLGRMLSRLHRLVDVNEGARIKALRIQKQRIFSADDLSTLLRGLVRALSLALRALLLFLFVNVVFSFFEWSRKAALAVLEFVAEAFGMMVTSLVGYLPSLFIVIVVILIARYFVGLLKLVFDGMAKGRIALPGFYPEWASTSFNLARLLVIALTLIIIFPYLPGSGSPAFQGLSIFFGVLLSPGSSSAVANIISGIVITYTRAFQLDDRVRIDDTEGDVVERSAFVTRIRTPKNVEVAIPNSMVMSGQIINFSTQARDSGLLLHTTVTIGYDVPWDRAHELLLEAARRTEHLENDPAPFVLQTSLDDHYVAYELNAYTHEASGKQRIYSDLHANIQDCFQAAGVEILSPHYRANRDGSEWATPGSELRQRESGPERGRTS